MNTNFNILDKYPNKIGNYQSNSLTSFLKENEFINYSSDYNQQNTEDLIYKLMSNNITFANATDFRNYLKLTTHRSDRFALSILLLSNMHFFQYSMFKDISHAWFKEVTQSLFTYKVSKNLFERIKPFINTNYKIIESIDNKNVIIYNQDILKGIPLVKFKLQDKILMYALDYDNWKYLLYTGKNISHISNSKKVTDSWVVDQIINVINILNNSYVLPNYENSIKQIIRNYIKIHDPDTMYYIHRNNSYNNSKFLYEVYGENTLIQSLNSYTRIHPLRQSNLNYGEYFFKTVDLTKLKLITDKKPSMVHSLIESYPSILYRLDKSYFDKFDFAFFNRIIILVTKQLKERNHPDYNLDLVKKVLSIFENRRFENKIYKHYPKLKMLLVD
jgi:hypothetical protein